MPTKSATLFHFIQNLTSSEIKAFRHLCSYQSGEKEYLKLFDLLRQMKVYDPQKVEKAFAGTKLLANLSRTKDYLYDLILRSLANYYHEPGASLSILMREIEVERNREHLSNAYRLVQKAKKLAWDEERFEALLTLLQTERSLLLERIEVKELEVQLEDNAQRTRQVQQLLSNYHRFLEMENVVIKKERREYLRKGFQGQSHIQELSDHPLLAASESPPSIRATAKWLRVRFEIARVTRDHDEAMRLLDQEIRHFEAHPFLLQDHTKRYYDALYLLCIYHQLLRNAPEARDIIDRLKRFYQDDQRNRIVLFEHLVLALFGFAHEYNDVAMAQEALLFLHKESVQIDMLRIETQIIVHWYAARVAIGQQNFAEAAQWLQKIIQLPKTPVRVDFQVSARLLHSVVLFEQREWDHLHSVAGGYARFVKKFESQFPYEVVVIQGLRKLPNQKSDASVVEFLILLLARLQEYHQDAHQQYALHYFDLTAWIEAKITQATFFSGC